MSSVFRAVYVYCFISFGLVWSVLPGIGILTWVYDAAF